MDSNPICHPSPAQKKWNAHFWITFSFWWWAGLVDGLIPHPPALSSQKNEMLNLWLCSTSDDRPGWLMDSNPNCHPSPARKMKCLFLDYIHFWWLAGLVNGLEPHRLHPLQPKKLKCLFLDYIQPLMISWADQWTRTPSTTPLQPKKMKCSFLDYIQILISGWAGWWTWTPSTTPLQPKKWNVYFWITFNFWWLAALVDGLKPHLPPLTSPKKWNAHFWITFNFWWSAGLVDGLKRHPPPLSSPEKWNACFWIIFTSDDWLGWSMDLNPIHHHSPAKKMKYLFLDYIQLLMISWADQWTRTPSATPLQPKNWNAHFWITFKFWSPGLVDGLEPHLPPSPAKKNEMFTFGWRSTSDDRLGWSMDLNPICHPSPTKKMKCSFLDYIQLLMIGRAGGWTWTPSATPLQPKKWNAQFLVYIQLLMIGWVGWWTQTPSATPLQPKKWNAHFWITFNFWWSAGLVDALEPHLPPLSSQKNKKLASPVKGLPICSSLWML